MTALIFMRLARFLNHGRSGDYANTLTRRELDVLSLLEEGLCNKEIARKLSIRTATVKNHVHNILGKLQLRRRSEVPSRMTALREARFTRSRS
jgi:DNA-binding NarL/FixJ family response regulator